jgi:hypothetical protein
VVNQIFRGACGLHHQCRKLRTAGSSDTSLPVHICPEDGGTSTLRNVGNYVCWATSRETTVSVFASVKASVLCFVVSSEQAVMCLAGCRYRWGRSPFTLWVERVWSFNIFTALRQHRIHLITYECYCIVGRPWAYSGPPSLCEINQMKVQLGSRVLLRIYLRK